MFFRGPRVFWVLAHVFSRPKVLDPGLGFHRTKDFFILAHVFQWTKVSWALAHVLKGPKVLDTGSCFQRS